MRSPLQISLLPLALSLLLAAPLARADVAPGPCDTKTAGDACTTLAGAAGTCQMVNGYLDCVATAPTTSSSTTTGAGGGTGTGGSSGGGDQDDDSGCSFAAPTPATGAGLGLLLGLGALLVDRRRRRPRA